MVVRHVLVGRQVRWWELWTFYQLCAFSVLQDARPSPESEDGSAGDGEVKRKEET